ALASPSPAALGAERELPAPPPWAPALAPRRASPPRPAAPRPPTPAPRARRGSRTPRSARLPPSPRCGAPPACSPPPSPAPPPRPSPAGIRRIPADGSSPERRARRPARRRRDRAGAPGTRRASCPPQSDAGIRLLGGGLLGDSRRGQRLAQALQGVAHAALH